MFTDAASPLQHRRRRPRARAAARQRRSLEPWGTVRPSGGSGGGWLRPAWGSEARARGGLLGGRADDRGLALEERGELVGLGDVEPRVVVDVGVGPVHIMVGGLWGMNEKEWVAPLAENEDWFLLASKYMWRQGYVRCPETCSMDAPVSDCFCECPSDVLAGMSSTEALNRTGVLGLFGGDASTFNSYGISDDQLLSELCLYLALHREHLLCHITLVRCLALLLMREE